MYDDEAIVLRAISRNGQGEFAPLCRADIGGIEVAKDCRIDIGKPCIFRQLFDEGRGVVTGFEVIVAFHAEGSPRVNEQNAFLDIGHHWC